MYTNNLQIKRKLTIEYLKEDNILSTITPFAYTRFKKIFSLIFGLFLLIGALLIQIVKNPQRYQIYFDISVLNLVILLILIMLSISLNLILFQFIKRSTMQDDSFTNLQIYKRLDSISELLSSLVILAPFFYSLGSLFIEIETFFLIFFGVFYLFLNYIYGHGTITSKIYLSSSPLTLQTQAIIPLPFAHIIIKRHWESLNGKTIQLALLLDDKSQIRVQLHLKGKRLFKYNFLTLKDAESFANSTKEFNIYVTGKKIEPSIEYGSLLTQKANFNELMSLINYLTLFTQTEVIKPEIMSEQEFLAKIVLPKESRHKKNLGKLLLLIFTLTIILAVDILLLLMIFITSMIIFAPTSASLSLNIRILFLVFVGFEIELLFIPPMFILWG